VATPELLAHYKSACAGLRIAQLAILPCQKERDPYFLRRISNDNESARPAPRKAPPQGKAPLCPKQKRIVADKSTHKQGESITKRSRTLDSNLPRSRIDAAIGFKHANWPKRPCAANNVLVPTKESENAAKPP